MRSKSLKRFFSLCLSCLLLLSTLTLSSFAVSDNLIDSNMTSSEWSWQQPLDYLPTISYDSSTNTNTFNLQANQSGRTIYRITLLDNEDTFVGHTYRFSCSYKGYFANAPVQVELQLHSPNQVYYDIIGVFNTNTGNDYVNFSLDFNILEQGYFDVTSVSLRFVFDRNNNNQHILYFKDVSLVDLDIDNSPSFWHRLYLWLQSIITKLQTVGESIVNGISSAISSLGNSISGFFVSLGEGIEEGFDTLRDWILYFQHPVDLDENGVPVDENGIPIYENIFDIPDFFETIEDWIDTLDDSKTTVNSNVTAGIEKIGLVTGYLNTMTAIPIISILVSFGLAVIVIKKVLG